MPASEALEPGFGCFWFDVTETVCKRRGSACYLSKDTFDSSPISVAFSLKSQPCSVQCSVEVSCAVDEKDGVFDIVLLLKLSEKYLGKSGCRGSKQPKMEKFVRFWISSVHESRTLVQPIRNL